MFLELHSSNLSCLAVLSNHNSLDSGCATTCSMGIVTEDDLLLVGVWHNAASPTTTVGLKLIEGHQGHGLWCPYGWPQCPSQNHCLAFEIFVPFLDLPICAVIKKSGLALKIMKFGLAIDNPLSLRSDGVPLSGESPARQDFPRQSHRGGRSPDFSRWPHRPCWVRGRNSDLGLVIDIAQLLLSNVRMREMCWHGDLTQSRCAQQKPLNRDCPRQAGAFDDSLDGRS